MTKKEARNLLNNSRPKGNNAYSIMLNEALDMAIQALKQDSCEDAISRQAVINAIANTCFWLSANNWEELTKCIDSLPSVKPQYTDAEIQKMQEMQQAEIEKAYELGKAEEFDNLEEMLEKLWNEVEE